ncbi:quinol:cytochrome C oxidoreductase [Gimesia sp.]|uniref:quinol:cytochrome C oxidoreductase n=1 Tax=Gimesia sp. TaxID=2024833 RepID=UPI000C4DD0C8|nr:quinol:cytochrome C oxidoreductase [Gimesia sp.]MAX35956.1 quinol:cytochrome C oxidoreductase [Gimesia sp.]HBL45845.1 quinol:cytochrome C oxidoreductase [Planctomycetaceae bacterium]|tara:strand:+ start:501 stop:1742 length:1242 start_codon:yes stop_codon:yes gene_type:complete
MQTSPHTDKKIPVQTLAELGSLPMKVALGCSALLPVSFLLGFVFTNGWDLFAFSYLQSTFFCLSISLGALFFVMIQQLTRAGWSVVLRRLSEFISLGVIPLSVLVLPIVLITLMGNDTLYEWANTETVAEDHLLHAKSPYLNTGFFALRYLIYFGSWIFLARYFLGKSVAQDATGDPELTLLMERRSGPAILLYAFTLSFAAIDFIMSLNAHWFSTIFGIYYFAAGLVGFFSFLAISLVFLRSKGLLQEPVTVEHLHDVGKLLFAFNCFWAYIAISQYLLIWYANIPEETVFFLDRQSNGWGVVSLILVIGHFAIPFVFFMSRWMKRNPKALCFWAVYLLIMNWVDIFWLVMPNMASHGESSAISFGMILINVCCTIGVGGIFVAGILKFAGEKSLMPVRDPRLEESLEFHNI